MSRQRYHEQYIIRKSAHRLHPRTVVRAINAYCGKLCEFAGVKPLDLYTSLDAAIGDARKLYEQESCGWDVYLVGSCPPQIVAVIDRVGLPT